MDRDGAEHESLWSARCSPSSSVSDESDEQSSTATGDAVFVAVTEDINEGVSTLLWAMKNLAKDGSRVVIAHVHSPTRDLNKMGVKKSHHTSMRPEVVNNHRKLEREKAEKNIDEYALRANRARRDLELSRLRTLSQCGTLLWYPVASTTESTATNRPSTISAPTATNLSKMDCDKVMIERDDVAEGLVELVALYGITKLVMGAAADQHYSKEMKTPKSKTALKLMETVASSCKIWFTCNGHLICTSEMNENLSAISQSQSPVQINTKPSSASSISSQMRSMALKNEASSEGYNSGSLIESTMSDWDIFFGDWGKTGYASSRTDDAVGISEYTSLPVFIGDVHEPSPVKHSPTYESYNVHFLEPECDMEEETIVDEESYVEPQEVYTEAELWEEGKDDESNKRRKAELDLLSALQRVKNSEDSYLHEVRKRKEIEKILARQRLEIDEMKRQQCALHDELHDSKKQKLMLEQHITQTESAANDYVKEITDFFTQESYNETKKRRKLKTELLSALQRGKEMENLYQNEKGQRLDMDEKIMRQRMEIEETKRQRDELYYELKDFKEQRLRQKQNDVSEETNKRRSAERDLLIALQRVKDLEHLFLHEMRKRKEMEETLAIQKDEIQETKGQLEDMCDKHMSNIKSTIKVYKEKLEKSKHFIQELQAKYDKLQHERETEVTKAEELRQKNNHGTSVTAKALKIDFSLSELQQATKGFNTTLKIGEGGFGSVYKGFLRNTTVAVKMLHPQSLQGQQEFHQEVAFLNTVRHPNIMMLIGACQEAFGLVYEFLPNGTLEDRLSCKENTPPLTWQVRTRIIGEICSYLTFIHSHKPHPIVHGDLNPDNILLDDNFVSKLKIYGFPKHFKATKNTKGNFSNMDPKFLTPQCDVYYFGIIILRLLTGRSPQKIVATVEAAMEKGHLHSIMDASAGSWPFVQANQLAHLGLRCANLRSKLRPDLVGEAWGVIEPLMKAASLNAGRSSLAASSDDTHTPASFVCPIFQEVMSDPHIAADGFTYEAEAIRGWLDGGHDTSPMTNLKLEHCELTPNRALRTAIVEWEQQQHRT